MYNDTTPIWQLTVGELKDLIQETTGTKTEPKAMQTTEGYVYGIAGLAELIGTSKTTAQRIKSSGLFNEAITQIGRKMIINKKVVIEILSNKKLKKTKYGNKTTGY